MTALAEAHPHLKGLLYFAGKSLPKLAQPLAARKYGRDQEQAVLASWLSDVRSWVDTWGAEAVEEALARGRLEEVEGVLARWKAEVDG